MYIKHVFISFQKKVADQKSGHAKEWASLEMAISSPPNRNLNGYI